jgi:toxin ParE1/3/4
MARRIRLSLSAQTDIVDVLGWTHEHLGTDARRAYEALITAAIREIATDPAAPGTARPELGDGARCWHLSRSRNRTGERAVRRPRHLIVYRIDGDIVSIARVLHEAMDIPERLRAFDVHE